MGGGLWDRRIFSFGTPACSACKPIKQTDPPEAYKLCRGSTPLPSSLSSEHTKEAYKRSSIGRASDS